MPAATGRKRDDGYPVARSVVIRYYVFYGSKGLPWRCNTLRECESLIRRCHSLRMNGEFVVFRVDISGVSKYQEMIQL